MADQAITLRGVTSGLNSANDLSVNSHGSTANNDYLVAVSLSVYRQTNPGVDIQAVTGVTWGSPIATSVHDVGGQYRAVARAWLGRVTTSGVKSVTIDSAVVPGDESEQMLHVYTLNPGAGGTITVDGTPTTQQDLTSPYTHSSITVAGSLDMLICAQSIVTFAGTLNYGVAPTLMTEGAETLPNGAVGGQSCYQMLSASGATSTRAQTSNIADVSSGTGGGSAGLMFALRNQVADGPSGPEVGRLLIAY